MSGSGHLGQLMGPPVGSDKEMGEVNGAVGNGRGCGRRGGTRS